MARYTCERCCAPTSVGVTCDECYTDVLYRNLRSRTMRRIMGRGWVRERMAELRFAVAITKAEGRAP